MNVRFFKSVHAAVLFCVLSMTVSGCRSVQFSRESHSPLAVVSVYSNPSLPWYDPQARSTDAYDDSLPGTLMKKSNSENPELYTARKRIDGAYTSLTSALQEAGIEMLDAADFADTDEYEKASRMFLSSLETDISADGLKILDYRSGRKYRDLARETGAGSLMFVEFTFNKQKMPSGLHDNYVLARCSMNVYIYDGEGTNVFHRKYTGISESGPAEDNGSYSKEELVELYPEAVDQAVSALVRDLLEAGK